MRDWDRHTALLHRLVLALLADDEHGYDTVADEIGDCAHCWRAITRRLAGTTATYMAVELGPEEAIARVQLMIGAALNKLDEPDEAES